MKNIDASNTPNATGNSSVAAERVMSSKDPGPGLPNGESLEVFEALMIGRTAVEIVMMMNLIPQWHDEKGRDTQVIPPLCLTPMNVMMMVHVLTFQAHFNDEQGCFRDRMMWHTFIYVVM